MCGFAGFLQKGTAVPAEGMAAVAQRMADALAHRGPDDSGTWTDVAAGIALGHRRLSIIDLSPEGHQPMVSPSGRYVIAFNGEIYNFEALRKELPAFGWRGHSDTEVMLAAFECWGIAEALRRFNGMFAFALWDRADRALYLARDRMGEKPLYYGWIGSTLMFGSELKALRAHPQWRADINRDAVAVYLRHDYVPAPYSIYSQVAKLPAAHYVRVSVADAGTSEPEPYWSLREAAERGAKNPIGGDERGAVDDLDALLRDAVQMRTVADVPVGVFLSGGVDSSTIVALMQAQASRPVKSFSIGFAEDEYNEAHHAKAVAAHLGTDHTELYVTPEEALRVIPRLPEVYDEPFADSSQIPTILVSRLARRDVTVTLSGDGGDELFCGYARYFWGRRIWGKIRRIPTGVRHLAARALTSVSPDAWNALIAPVSKLARSTALGEMTGDRIHKMAEVLGVQSADVMYRGLASHWSDPAAIVAGAREPLTVLTDPAQRPALEDFTHRMMYFDAMSYLPEDILVKVDRASMSVSLEARVPLLDHRVVEYAWRVPLSMNIRGDEGKSLLRQVLYRYVPRELIERPKMGFGVPIDKWLRGPLRGWAESLLDERRLREDAFFDPAPIRKKWAEHLSGVRNWQYWLWDILMFQAWLDAQRT